MQPPAPQFDPTGAQYDGSTRTEAVQNRDRSVPTPSAIDNFIGEVLLGIALLLLFGGVYALARAIELPSNFDLSGSPSAIQITQVYTEATYRAVLAVGVFAAAITCAVIGAELRRRYDSKK